MRTLFPSAVLLTALGAGCAAATDDASEPSAATSIEIVGGTVAAPNAWPSVVAIYAPADIPTPHEDCGGTVIAAEWVLTAAHCILTPDRPDGGFAKVVIGRQKLSQTAAGEERAVDRVVPHPGFVSATEDNDIALLHLATPTTHPLTKLATAAQAASLTAGTTMTVVGWGTLSANQILTSDVLRQVDIPLITNAKCKALPQYRRITDDMMCAVAAGGSRDACTGDSGGPAFLKVGTSYVQAGIVSWGIGCGNAADPGVYIRVGKYLSWIHQATNGAAGSAN